MRSTWAAVVACLCCHDAAAQNAPIAYTVSFDNAVHHEAQITATFRELDPAPLELRMSRSSPGRYALHEFAKNVYDVRVTASNGKPLAVTRTDPYSWQVSGHDGTVVLSYTLFADHGDGTYSQIDTTHAHLNMPATFMWARGLEQRAISLTLAAPRDDWQAFTQLPVASDGRSFTAPDLQYFMDSPVEFSAAEVREWQLDDGQTVRLVVHQQGDTESVDKYAQVAKQLVAGHIAMFGEAPRFDYGVYTFLGDYMPQNEYDGMEHRNSTFLTQPVNLTDGEFSQAETLAHEFFHAWNMERLRPAELEPFDFTRANPTPSLWFGEGFTNYYGNLVGLRAGAMSLDDYLGYLQATLSGVTNAPGRATGSPQSMSLMAPFTDAGTSIDPDNFRNAFISYYPYGEIIALALDLSLRQRFPGITLDDYMRQLWRSHGVTEIPYTHADLREALVTLTGNREFAEAFFASYIEQGDLPDFAPLLEQAGLLLRPASPDRAALGRMNFETGDKAVLLAANTVQGSPLYQAGLERGDEILRIGRSTVRNPQQLSRFLQRYRPGDRVSIGFRRNGQILDTDLTLAADQDLAIIPVEKAGMMPSPQQRAFRHSWLKTDL